MADSLPPSDGAASEERQVVGWCEYLAVAVSMVAVVGCVVALVGVRVLSGTGAEIANLACWCVVCVAMGWRIGGSCCRQVGELPR